MADTALIENPRAGEIGIHSVYRVITELNHPEADKVLAFWAARPADGYVIGRDLPSRAIASLLSRIIVHEPVDGGADLKVRIAGVSIRRRFGDDITGKTMSELFPTPDYAARRQSVLDAIAKNGPQYADCMLSSGSLDVLHTELVILPVVAPNRVDKWGMTFCLFFT